MIRNFAVRGVLCVALLSGLVACGSDSAGTATSIATGANGTLTYGYYLDSTGGISLYDPASTATTPVPVAVGPVYLTQPVNGGTYNASNRFVTNLHTRTLAYSASGKLWKVSNVKTGTTPVPAQVSNESALAGPDLLCDIQVYPDYANHDNSRVVYTKTTTTCSPANNQAYSTTLAATSGTIPTTYAAGATVVAPIYDVTTGAISGFLLRDGADVVKVAPDFSVPATVDTAAASVGATATMLKNGKMFLVEDDVSNRTYKLYDPAAPITLGTNPSLALLTIPSANTVYTVSAADNSMYIADATAGAIYRLPADGSPAVTLTSVATGETADAIQSLRLTMNRAVYTWDDGTDTKIRAVDKTAVGATPSDLFTVANAVITGNGVYFPDFARKDELRFPAPGLFFTVEYTAVDKKKEACLVAETDGSVPSCSDTAANEYWTGYNESSVFDFGSTIMSRVYKAADDSTNITLTSYDVGTGTAVATLTAASTLGTGIVIRPQVRANNYNATLFIGTTPDVWHANTGTVGSLTQMTNTTGTVVIGSVSTE